MIDFIERKLNSVTMYRLVLYYLLGLFIFAVIFGYFGILPYTPLALVLSTIYITFICWLTNLVFSRVFNAQTNIESVYITALILVFIITPLKSFIDIPFLTLAGWAGVLAMASKYILAIRKKHLFNPAAIAVVLTALFLGQSASWWVGTSSMVIPVIVGGFLLTRKILRWDLVISFLVTSFITIVISRILVGGSIFTVVQNFLLTSPVWFFAFVMLTEPLTTPPTRNLRIMYGILTGFLFTPAIHVGSIYSTPELALVVGNLFVYIISPKEKMILKLKELKEIGKDTYDFIFTSDRKFSFKPGQYLEWTLGHKDVDSRGNRRYFTLASSPTENTVRMGVRFFPESSSFKSKLKSLKPGDTIVAHGRAGDFVLPKDKNKKLVFIAGGIGITPFRSMIKYLLDTKQKRDIVLFYSNKKIEDVVYTDVFDEALNELNIRTVYTLTDKTAIPTSWLGETGHIDKTMIIRNVPDFQDRTFYISGPSKMVEIFEDTLVKMGVKKSAIVTDFFPGF